MAIGIMGLAANCYAPKQTPCLGESCRGVADAGADTAVAADAKVDSTALRQARYLSVEASQPGTSDLVIPGGAQCVWFNDANELTGQNCSGIAAPQRVSIDQPVGPPLDVIYLDELVVRGKLSPRGGGPLVIVARSIDVSGVIDLTGDRGGPVRPPGANSSQSPIPEAQGLSGGGGGGFATEGGNGGDGPEGGASYQIESVLRGGSAGGRPKRLCGQPTANAGGAILLYATEQIIVNGTIVAGGAGGVGGCMGVGTVTGGGGGASGGAIVLQAPRVAGDGAMYALGGGGGAGGSEAAIGVDGQSGGTAIGQGGTGPGGTGGRGGGAALPNEGLTAATSGLGHGGGGGAAGIIEVFVASGATPPAFATSEPRVRFRSY